MLNEKNKNKTNIVVSASNISKTEFLSYYGDSCFAVLKDEKTIIGISRDSRGTLVKENISLWGVVCTPHKFTTRHRVINTVMLYEKRNMVFSGEDGGTLIQYNLTTGNIERNFGNLRIGDIVSMTRLGPIGIIGGFKQNHFSVVMLNDKEHSVHQFQCGINYLSSLQICVVKKPFFSENKQVLLCISGYDASFIPYVTDVFKITSLVKQTNKILGKRKALVAFEHESDTEEGVDTESDEEDEGLDLDLELLVPELKEKIKTSISGALEDKGRKFSGIIFREG